MASGNLLFLLVLLLGPLVSVSSSNWVICWVGLELSFLGMIPMLLEEKSFLTLSKESVMKYFCIQALSSGLLMVGGVMFYMSYSSAWLWEFLFISSLFIKLGVFPMHFWVPGVVAGLNWFPMFILLTWQKVGPFAFLINVVESSVWTANIILMFGGASAVIGAILGLNQTSVRAMLGSSSISHTGWSLVGVAFGNLWLYFFIYCVSFGLLMTFFQLGESLMIGLGILSLSGLPPFVMFIGKWSILKSFFYSGSSWVFLIFPIVGALLSLFFYLKFFYSYYLDLKILDKGSSAVTKFLCMMFLLVFGSTYLFFL